MRELRMVDREDEPEQRAGARAAGPGAGGAARHDRRAVLHRGVLLLGRAVLPRLLPAPLLLLPHGARPRVGVAVRRGAERGARRGRHAHHHPAAVRPHAGGGRVRVRPAAGGHERPRPHRAGRERGARPAAADPRLVHALHPGRGLGDDEQGLGLARVDGHAAPDLRVHLRLGRDPRPAALLRRDPAPAAPPPRRRRVRARGDSREPRLGGRRRRSHHSRHVPCEESGFITLLQNGAALVNMLKDILD
ncbi:hypothetical protein R5R35_011270 [Gryllus longicercus]|uniref:Uncharacterized protein n=1 Tax=Gryllus longicercus TaxID=2509291 RepID=A0AAN9Z1A5_9ORTH